MKRLLIIALSLIALPAYALVVGYSRTPQDAPSGTWYTLQGTAATTVGADCTGGSGGYQYGEEVYDAPATGTITIIELYAGSVSGTPSYVARIGSDGADLNTYDDEATGEITSTGAFEITFSTGKSVTLGDDFGIAIKGTDSDTFRLSRSSSDWAGGLLRYDSDDDKWGQPGTFTGGDLYLKVYIE